ncbi:MAG TPA: ATP-binding protein, partial [Psychromonas sp.]
SFPLLDNRQLQDVTSSDLDDLSLVRESLQKFAELHPEATVNELLEYDPGTDFRKVYLTDSYGRLINDQAPRKMRQFILDSDSEKMPRKKILTQLTYLGPIVFEHKQRRYLLYFSAPSQKESLEVIEWLIDNPFILLLTALIISTPICAMLAWHLTQPLRQLQDVAHLVAQGELNTQFPTIKNSDEIEKLANSMQLMVTFLKNMLNNQQRLLSDISHELRSPLTRLGLALAISKKHFGESKDLLRIELETKKIESMLTEVLNLSRIQLTPVHKESIALNEFLEELFLDAEFEANEYGKKFIYPRLSTVKINVYPEFAYRAIENVIRNAIKYAEHKINVKISITVLAITVSIENDGPLIPENELKNIFRPFYRLSEARERETGGEGLGLSIAENAMFKHGGKIWAENIDNKVCMHLQFPRYG